MTGVASGRSRPSASHVQHQPRTTTSNAVHDQPQRRAPTTAASGAAGRPRGPAQLAGEHHLQDQLPRPQPAGRDQDDEPDDVGHRDRGQALQVARPRSGPPAPARRPGPSPTGSAPANTTRPSLARARGPATRPTGSAAAARPAPRRSRAIRAATRLSSPSTSGSAADRRQPDPAPRADRLARPQPPNPVHGNRHTPSTAPAAMLVSVS